MTYRITGDDFADFFRPDMKKNILGQQENYTFAIKDRANITYKTQLLDEGISIVQANYRATEDLIIDGRGDKDLLEIQINLSDKGIRYRDHARMEKNAPAQTGNLVFLPVQDNFAEIMLPKNTEYGTFDIHLPIHILQRYAGESAIVDRLLQDIATSQSSKLSETPILLSPSIYHIITQIKSCPFDGFTRKVYLESKVYELIALLHQQTLESERHIRLSHHDRDKIKHVADLIRDNLDSPLTVIELARLAGLNQTKLKIGFKQLFGTTIFGYLQELRMLTARSYLLDTDLSIQEISLLLGYNNSSNFSIAFKRFYGNTPNSLR